MFEITDEFLAQAGFGSLPADKKEQMREDVANSVQDKITRKILLAVGEAKLDEFMKLLDGYLAINLHWHIPMYLQLHFRYLSHL